MSAQRFYLLPLSLGVSGAIASAFGLATAVRSFEFELPARAAMDDACRRLIPLRGDVPSLFVLLLAALGLVVLARGARSLIREWRSQQRFRRGLRVVSDDVVAGTPVRWIDGARPRAFCAGLIRPRVYVSVGAGKLISREQLEAIVAHERHHVRRRDPLRMLVVAALADSLFFMPVLLRLAERYRALAELAADETAARAKGRRALASAMLAIARRDDSQAIMGIAPERVDQLLGRRVEWRLPSGVLTASALALGSVVALLAATRAAAGLTSANLTSAAVSVCSASMLIVPVLALAAVGYRLRPLLRGRY